MSDLKWTVVTCTDCERPVEVAGRIELPFVCVGCRQEAEEFNRTTAPAAEYVPDPRGAFEHGDPGDEHVHNSADSCCGEPADGLDETNTLIADQEQQTAVLREGLANDAKVIADLEDENRSLRESLEQADRLIEDLDRENEEIMGELKEGAETMEAATLALRALRGLTQTLRAERDAANHRVETYRQMFLDVSHEASFYENRGFWARLFNRRYRKQPTSYLNRVVSNDRQTSG